MAHERDEYEIVEQTIDSVVDLLQEKSRQRRRIFYRAGMVLVVTNLVCWLVVPAVFGPFALSDISMVLSLALFSLGTLISVVLHYEALQIDVTGHEAGMHERLMGRVLQARRYEKRKRDHLRDERDDFDEEDRDGTDASGYQLAAD